MRLSGEPVEELHHVHLGGEVEEGGGLIEEDDRGLLGKRLGNHHLLSLSVAERPDVSGSKALHAHETEGVEGFPLIGGIHLSPKAGVEAAPEGDKVEHGHVPHLYPLRQHDADESRQLPALVAVYLAPADEDGAAELGLEGGNRAEES